MRWIPFFGMLSAQDDVNFTYDTRKLFALSVIIFFIYLFLIKRSLFLRKAREGYDRHTPGRYLAW